MANKHSSLIDRLDRLEVFCREHGIEHPMMRLIEVDGVLRPYFIPLHLVKNDQMNQFDAEVVFLLVDYPDRENREAEECRLKVVAKEFERPCLLTTRAAFSPRQGQLLQEVWLHENARNVVGRGWP